MTGGGLFHPLIEMAAIGSCKYWFSAITLLTGTFLFIAVRSRPLSRLFNILFYIFFVLAMALVFFSCAAERHDKPWNSIMEEIIFFGGYIPIIVTFIPAIIFKALGVYCRHRQI